MKWIKNIGNFLLGMLISTILLFIVATPILFLISRFFDDISFSQIENYVPGENFPFR